MSEPRARGRATQGNIDVAQVSRDGPAGVAVPAVPVVPVRGPGAGGLLTHPATTAHRAPRPSPLASQERTGADPGVPPVFPAPRDAVFRRLLAVADLLAAIVGLAIVGAGLAHGLDFVSLATVPLIVVIAKTTGRYDHDEVVLRKSTLDEIPSLLALAASFALVWAVVASIAVSQIRLSGAEVALLSVTTAGLLVFARALARWVAQLLAPVRSGEASGS